MKKIFSHLLSLLIIILSFSKGFTQTIPVAPRQDSLIILMNGTAYLGNGQVIENSAIGFENGKITFVADARTIRLSQSNAKIINIAGKQVYPGLIACNTSLGLNEIEASRATRDASEVGDFNPNIRSIIAYNTDSKVIPTVRSNGILLAQVVPQGGIISGASSVVQLDAWNWEDAQYKTDEGIHLNFPSYTTYHFNEDGGTVGVNEKFSDEIQNIRNFFDEAKAYAQSSSHENTNLKFEAMRGLFSGEKKLYIHADGVKEITAAVLFAKSYNISCVIVGGNEAWKCADILVANHVSVILGRIQSLPGSDDEDYDLPYRLPSLLKKAGVDFCLSMDGFWQQRNLSFLGGEAVAYGSITSEEAIEYITLNAARILGIDSLTGTLEQGKDANIIVSDGDILDMKTSNIIYAFIQGREINLDNKQKDLYEIYKEKYGIK
ncbi:MAG TPA: amidohydrolase [Bacteroidetes bacterium]|nr:amidohydrolase [Bacteroidota bacterium]